MHQRGNSSRNSSGTPTHGAIGGNNNHQNQQQQMQQQQRRGNKTLGWFISEKILSDKTENEGACLSQNEFGGGNSNNNSPMPPPQHNRVNLLALSSRKGSLESPRSLNKQRSEMSPNQVYSRRNNPNGGSGGRHRPRANSNVPSTTFHNTAKQSLGSNNNNINNGGEFGEAHSKENCSSNDADEKEKYQKAHQASLQQSGTPQRTSQKEDYWYYDATSDGFYYEYNGTRGWRKRNPKLHNQVPISSLIPQQQRPYVTAKNEAAIKLQEEAAQMRQQLEQHMLKTSSSSNNQPLQQQQQQQLLANNKFVPTQQQNGGSPLAQPPPSIGQSNIKYYDAASDGYFYEMASVDGWRRRRGASPTSSNKGGQKPPPSIQQQHQQQISGGIASQLLMGAPHQQQMKPPSLPLQFQSYIGGQHQQPSHQLTPAELNEILMKHSQNLPFRFAPGQEKVQPPVLPPCCAPSVVAPTSIPPPQPSSAVSANNCCCCQMAVAAHMLMHDRMQQLQLMTTDPATAATMNNINNKCCNCTSPAESGNSSSTTTYNKNLNLTMNGSNNTSTTPFSASSEAKSSASPPPLLHSITGQQPLEGSNNIIIKDQRRHNSVSHIDKWKKSGDGGRDSRFQQGGFSQPFTSAFLDGRPIDIALGRKQPQKMLPSSFEEPYEFYWSDSDAKSNNSIASATTVPPEASVKATSGQPTLVATPADDLLLDEPPFALSGLFNNSSNNKVPPGSEGSSFRHAKSSSEESGGGGGQGSVQNRRPDSLKLSCGMPGQNVNPMREDEKQQRSPAPAAYLPYFNVDKFIADLPQAYDPEKVLYNLSSLQRTPMLEQQQNGGPPRLGAAPTTGLGGGELRLSTTESPLYTPIFSRDNFWAQHQQQHSNSHSAVASGGGGGQKMAYNMGDSGAGGGGGETLLGGFSMFLPTPNNIVDHHPSVAAAGDQQQQNTNNNSIKNIWQCSPTAF